MSVIVDGRVKLTYGDFRRIPDDRCSHELIDGEHFMAPAPGTHHQTILGHLFFQLYAQIELAGTGRVFCAPVDVQLSQFDIVEPDIVAIGADRDRIIHPTRVIGAPDFVVEILSPHTRRKDRELKRALYERQLKQASPPPRAIASISSDSSLESKKRLPLEDGRPWKVSLIYIYIEREREREREREKERKKVTKYA